MSDIDTKLIKLDEKLTVIDSKIRDVESNQVKEFLELKNTLNEKGTPNIAILLIIITTVLTLLANIVELWIENRSITDSTLHKAQAELLVSQRNSFHKKANAYLIPINSAFETLWTFQNDKTSQDQIIKKLKEFRVVWEEAKLDPLMNKDVLSKIKTYTEYVAETTANAIANGAFPEKNKDKVLKKSRLLLKDIEREMGKDINALLGANSLDT